MEASRRRVGLLRCGSPARVQRAERLCGLTRQCIRFLTVHERIPPLERGGAGAARQPYPNCAGFETGSISPPQSL
jgi:hypothetical protein